MVSDSTADNIGVGGTMQLTYTLNNIPGNPVSVAVASSDTGAFTVSPSSIQFSDSVLVQTITVTGVGASTASIVLTSSDTPRVTTFSKDFVSFGALLLPCARGIFFRPSHLRVVTFRGSGPDCDYRQHTRHGWCHWLHHRDCCSFRCSR